MLKCTREEFENTISYAFEFEVKQTRPSHLPLPETCQLLAQLCYLKEKNCPYLKDYLNELSDRGQVKFKAIPKDVTNEVVSVLNEGCYSTFIKNVLEPEASLEETDRVKNAIIEFGNALIELEQSLEQCGVEVSFRKERNNK